jgi:predicted O-methyltransferase YrrM
MIKQIVKHFKAKEEEYSREIGETFLYYTKAVSNPGMAASLRSCIFLCCMMELIKPKRVLDLGSGISSYSLRYFKGLFGLDTVIYSIDSSKEWLRKSEEFSRVRDVDHANFLHWDDIKDKKMPCELIFMDIDKTKFRVNYYEPVCRRFTKKGSLMLVDDMHKPVLREAVKKITVPHNTHTLNKETKHRKRYNWVLEFTGKK